MEAGRPESFFQFPQTNLIGLNLLAAGLATAVEASTAVAQSVRDAAGPWESE